jgi:hypothetical protein
VKKIGAKRRKVERGEGARLEPEDSTTSLASFIEGISQEEVAHGFIRH